MSQLLVPAESQRVFQPFGINLAGVRQDDLCLSDEERPIRRADKPLDRRMTEALDDRGRVLWRDGLIERALRAHRHKWAGFAKAHAANALDTTGLCQAMF